MKVITVKNDFSRISFTRWLLLMSLMIIGLSHLFGQLDGKIDLRLKNSNPQTTHKIVVVLKDQADVSGAKTIAGKDAKANFVFKTLLHKAVESQKELIAWLDARSIQYRSFYIVNMVSLEADSPLIEELAALPYVKEVIEDSSFKLEEPVEERDNTGLRAIEWNISHIKAPEVWAMGHTGQNVVIGGQDTGYKWDHAALINQYRGGTNNHNYHWHDAIHQNDVHNTGTNPCGYSIPAPCDDDNHGTHTMGTMAGDDGADNQIGVAPGAEWIGCRNMERGWGTLTTYNECFEWFLAPYAYGNTPAQGDPTKMPHVIANSWSCPTSEGCNTTNFPIMETALNNLRAAGCVIVVSAGNNGQGCNSVNAPAAIFEGSFSVGATNNFDNIASFSSRGPVTVDGSDLLKPEISAPGVNIRSSVKNGGYASMGGTSMAGPHVAGLVALIISANPNLAGEVDKIEEIIEQTALTRTSSQNCGAVPGSSIPNNTFGYGRIDALAAVNRAKNELYVPLIKVDQFGYRPKDQKIAILSDPQTGYNAADSYTPHSTIVVKNSDTYAVVFSGSPVAWKNGATHAQSGDKVWRFDFSTLETPGVYHVADGNNGQIRSADFEIREDIYDDAFKTAFKTFYYQRCGIAKTAAYTLEGYTDGICHNQDASSRFINDEFNSGLYKDLRGGWHDAGDYNKYINFAYKPLNDLLFAYEINPQAWASDNMNIPESGNGIPDLLDEIKYELDWMVKMQASDGGVHCVLGVKNYASASPPSADMALRYYGPKTTSASFSAAASFAFAARQFRKIPDPSAQSYAAVLQTKAVQAYGWGVSNPGVTYNNSGIIAAGEQETDAYERSMRRLTAAIFLYALTGDSSYKTYVESNYTNAHMIQWNFVYPFEAATQLSLLFYSHLQGVNSSVANHIKTEYKNSMDDDTDNFTALADDLDAYKAHLSTQNYTWGSNETKCNMANMYLGYHHYNLDVSKNATIEHAVAHYIHYMHGVNPNALTFLTNMYAFGAERSVNTIYHSWFTDGSALWDDVRTSTYGPAPGFIPGGPNPHWKLDNCCPNNCGSSNNNSLCINLAPPGNQPVAKSYLDWNTSWPQNSWEVTENAIYSQSAYMLTMSSMVNLAIAAHPDKKLFEIENADLLITNASNGLILTSPDGSRYKLTISNTGNIQSVQVTGTTPAGSTLQTASLYISKNEKGIILRSPNNNLWRLFADKSGSLQSQQVSAPLGFNLEQMNGDYQIDQYDRGLIVKDYDGNCYMFSVLNGGTICSKPVLCYE